ncbi:MAG: L-seryl-tRNA(Sec) selenium transferase [Acidobacteriota bacterium]
MNDQTLRLIPSVDSLLKTAKGRELIASFGRETVLKVCREGLEELRAEIHSDTAVLPSSNSFFPEAILERIASRLEQKFRPGLRKAINATGVLMHSGLGRAVLSEAAGQALAEIASGYSTLALDLETGRRGQRDAHVSGLLCELTGAEAATIVNNNAAATVLILNTLASGKEVIVSRGQLVEIGGSFRLPDVMRTSGALLKEVGTTNKTHLRDYEDAITQNTGLILRVHHSNYRILGFAEEPEIEPLAELGLRRGIPVVDDLGSGALVDLKEYDLETEPLVRRSIQAGVACACFSGDKLIGGPQSGLIVGRADYIQRIKKNPLVRAFRCGKLTLAAMEATLKLFLAPEKLRERHPVYKMISQTPEALAKRARRVANSLKKTLPPNVKITVIEGESQIGSGSSPVETIPTKMLSLAASSPGPDELARRLRHQAPAVFTRIAKDSVLFDFRTILPDEDNLIIKALVQIW